MSVAATDPSQIPGALQEHKRRELAGGGIIDYELAPYGWLTQDGERRQRDHRAYYWTPWPECHVCDGTGRIPSVKRPDGTIKCPPCKGSGECKRERMLSVTTLLDAICPKGGLVPWAEKQGITGTLEAVRQHLLRPEHTDAEAVQIVRRARLGADEARDTAATRGLNVHALLEHYMLTGGFPYPGDHPTEHQGYIQGLAAWLRETSAEPVEVEQLVCDAQAGYAGRRDLVAMVAGARVGYDLKTQERGGIYSSAHLQLRMYERAGIACGDEPCDQLNVVVVAANGEFREMACEATAGRVDAALAFAAAVRPIDALCESWNRAERKARAA